MREGIENLVVFTSPDELSVMMNHREAWWHKLTEHLKTAIPFFALFFPIIWTIIWIGAIGKTDSLFENTLLGLGGCFPSLYFYLRELRNNKKTRTLTLQRIKERLNGDMVLICHQERILLSSLMKGFIK